ncbi:MAG: DRTGG domain-containing protein [Oscillospiraceae bacterium]
MTAIEMAQRLGLKVINIGEGKKRNIGGVYCCDLLSIVMGRAKEDDAWITVMGNINSIAVAVLSDVSCIILSENMQLDIDGLAKAKGQDVCVLASELPTFEIALMINEVLHS